MNTPICDFVNGYVKRNEIRLHMPGHKGVSFLGVEDRDITEVEGADVLYSPSGIIAESQDNATVLFESGKTVYSTEGSSLCIRAMVYLAVMQARKNGKKPLILAARNAHKTFMSAVALLDAEVEWFSPSLRESVLSCRIDAAELDKKIEKMSELPVAVYITSPDYLGTVSDIAGISEICKKHGILLLVDNAHGAYLKFLPVSRHPIDLGADLCCDSAHKTLPVLTGGAYLHVSKGAPRIFYDMVTEAMSLFASTSPSYLVLQSLDLANKYMAEGYGKKLADFAERLQECKEALIKKGFSLIGNEELKLTVASKSYGYYGYELAEFLLEKGIVCEFSDPDFLVLMLTPENDGVFEKLLNVLEKLPRLKEISESARVPESCQRVLSVREAMLSPSEEIDVDEARGRILASPSISCPPAVPILVCGEMIDEKAIECFKYYGIEKCRVVELNKSKSATV